MPLIDDNVRGFLTKMWENEEFEELKADAIEAMQDGHLGKREAVNLAVDAFEASIDFDLMFNGKLEWLGDLLEALKDTLFRIKLRMIIRRLVRRWINQASGN